MDRNNNVQIRDQDSVVTSRDTLSPMTMQEYYKLYEFSVKNPDRFWKTISEDYYWKKSPSGKMCNFNFDSRKGPIEVKWMEDAETNICYNALDRNLKRGLSNKVAYYWEGNDVDEQSSITYGQLYKEVCKFANVLKSKGIGKGDRVTLYMPMVVELVIAMLACSRIGAVHNVVFGGFSSDSLFERIFESKSSLLVTADGFRRGTKIVNLKQIADEALDRCHKRRYMVKSIVVKHLTQDSNSSENLKSFAKRPVVQNEVSWNDNRNSWWHEEMNTASQHCDPLWVESEHPLFILYTSGSTGKPKGLLHTTAGYMLYAGTTFRCTFAYKPEDVYFCTADIGWITGHSYGVYGPLVSGASSVLFQGIPTHPDPGRYWAICEKYKVTKFYTAPTAIRSLMKFGNSYVEKHNLESLQVLGTVGEPINPEAWQWYHTVVGKSKCSIVDTYWQSETGGHVLTPLPFCTPPKPGSATLPFFGVQPAILSDQGQEISGPGEGHLVFKSAWPGMARTLYGNHERFSNVYFDKFPGYYLTGDGAYRDSDGYYWITGRTDDMMNVSGHLLSSAQVESSLVEHEACVEAAVVAQPHAVKGESLYCYVILKEGYNATDKLVFELKERVREKIGAFATPEYIHFTPALPKTRSGKIMRRVLRKLTRSESELGDLTTLAEPSVIDFIKSTKQSKMTSCVTHNGFHHSEVQTNNASQNGYQQTQIGMQV